LQTILIDQLSKHPSWRTLKVGMLKSMPKNMGAWLGRYAEILTTYDADSEEDKARAEREATEHYASNRAHMDEGAVAAWESCYDQDTEISALQHAMNILITTGEEAFACECQNSPLPPQASGLELPTAEELFAKTAPPPPNAPTITLGIDASENVLYFDVFAWSPDQDGYQLAGGAFPDQRRSYFNHSQLAYPLSKLFPRMSVEARITAGLNALLHGHDGKPGLMQQEWTIGGIPCKVRLCLVDANGEYRDTITRVLTNSPYSASLMPSYGRGVTAKACPISRWPEAAKQRTGGEWCLTKPVPGEVRGVTFDANCYKSRLLRRVALPPGTKGAIYLRPAAPDMKMVVDHLRSELPTEVTANGRTVIEWSLKPNCDNHRLDSTVLNIVASLVLGIDKARVTARGSRKRSRLAIVE
jgi:hypothetical protein